MFTVFDAVRIFGVTLVGVSKTTGVKLLFTLALILVVLLRGLVLLLARRALGGKVADQRRFWTRQGIQVLVAVVLVLGIVSIWVTPDSDITTGIGLISAGLAFALQQVILSLAAYFVILRGDTFGVGDRIILGGVRGDVVRLGFLKTTIMEMGQPPSVAAADPAVWVNSRQYTGRLVTVTNGVDLHRPGLQLHPRVPLPVGGDRAADHLHRRPRRGRADPARRRTRPRRRRRPRCRRRRWRRCRPRYAVSDVSLEPAVYWRITDNWLELSLRFLVPQRGVRDIKDRMNRDILAGLDAAGIGIASATYDIVGLPPITVTANTPTTD